MLDSPFNNITQISKKGSVLAEVMKDKHDKLSCLFVKDTNIIGSGDIPLESGGINMKERIARVLSIWLFPSSI